MPLVSLGQTSRKRYDGRNRLTAVNHPGVAAGVSYSYFADGALKTLTSAGSTWTYGYSKRRLLDTETLSLDGASYTLKHGWNATGHRSQLTYPDNVVVPFAPNALGEPTRAGNYAVNVKRHPTGTPETFAYGNGIAYSQTLNTRQLPQHRIEQDGNLKLADFLLGYDENANLTVIGDNSLAQPDSVEGLNAGLNLTAVEDRLLAYDGLNRLIQAHAPEIFGNETYAYDPLDNMRKVVLGAGPGALTLDYSYGQNRLTQLKLSQNGQQLIHSYTHNARGHMTKRGDQQHAFDAAGRMTAAITGQESYRYDGHGRRTVRQGPTGERAVTLYSQSGQLLYETRTPGQASCAPANDRIFCHGFDPPSGPSTSTRYVHLGHRLVAQHSANTITYLHTDPLGSVTMRTNPQRQVLSRALYEPYGSLAVGQIEQGPGYTGHMGDAATQLHYMQQRYYDPVCMCFLSPDPVYVSMVDGSNFNVYAYGNSNPYKYIDPDGRYGRGTDWSDKDWNRFDRAQQQAAGQIEKAADRINQALSTGKGMKSVTRAFEKAFGEGSATRGNMTKVAATLTSMAGALRDNGSGGHIANADTSLGSGTLAAAASGTKTIFVNPSHERFSSPSILRHAVGHESAHSIGKKHGIVNGEPSYKYGNLGQQKAFRALPSVDPAAAMNDPDTLMDYSQ